jgi:hypothetical protein
MAPKKTLAVVFAALVIPATSFATFETGALRVDINDAIQRLVAKYETRIAELEAENAELKKKLSGLAPGTVANAETSTGASSSAQSSKPASNAAAATANAGSSTVAKTGNADFDALVKSMNENLPSILKENGLSETAQLGLFEFVDGKKAFFISIDDGKNPTGISAFKTKILYSYDDALKTAITGKFDLNYDVQRYVTTFGTNPYAGTVRIRVKNPAYTGKLLEETASASAGTTPSSTASTAGATKPSTAPAPSTATVSADVTAKDVRAAYDKNKLAEAIKLANAYLTKNPRDVEILTVRYRSLYITGKYADSLKDIATIESVQGTKFDCTIAKDASFIAKSAKDTAAATRYSNYVANCKK